MVEKPTRARFFLLALVTLLCLLLVAGCGPQPVGQSVSASAFSFQPHQTSTVSSGFTPAGAAVWILSCQDGWKKQHIYQAHPYYTDQQGQQKPRDIYVFGHFWLQPPTGTLQSLISQSAQEECLTSLIVTAHTFYHARVCGVLAVNEGQGAWKPSDVVNYTGRAIANPALLTPLVDQMKQYSYDCLINDIEDGDRANPQAFSRYEALLHGRLSVPLGQTLLWKTSEVQAYWQKWQDWSTLANNADFFIIMALDQDSIHDPPVPASIVNFWWVKQIYAYLQSVPHLLGAHPIAWELPTYYRMFTSRQDGQWAISAGTDVQEHITTALHSPTIRQNFAQDPNDPYIEYTNAHGQDTYLFFETATSSDVLAHTLTILGGSTCLRLSFWDNDSGTSSTLGWLATLTDAHVHLC